MKSRKGIILLICLAVVAVVAVAIIILLFNSNKVEKLLEDENVQVELLVSIYKEMIAPLVNTNIVLDESVLKNILTNEKLSEENIIKLKELEKNIEGSDTFILEAKYLKKTHTIYLNFVDTRDNVKVRSFKYKIDVSNGKLIYNGGLTQTVFVTHAE